MSLTNAQKAQRLEEMANEACRTTGNPYDAALLRESAAMWRERGDYDESTPWDEVYERRYKRHDLRVLRGLYGAWHWDVSRKNDGQLLVVSAAGSLPAAQAAAVAWVDANADK
jgi:hypothetical protein